MLSVVKIFHIYFLMVIMILLPYQRQVIEAQKETVLPGVAKLGYRLQLRGQWGGYRSSRINLGLKSAWKVLSVRHLGKELNLTEPQFLHL